MIAGRRRDGWTSAALPLASSTGAIAGAFLAGAVFLMVMGKDPVAVYDRLISRGLLSSFGVTETLIKAAPLLIVAAGLLIALRAGVWNIGVDGQLLVGAAAAGYLAPRLVGDVPKPVMLAIAAAVGFAGGLAWAIVPAWLKVRYGLNEIITTIMMNYVAISLTAYLVKGPWKDPSVVPPQTALIPRDWRLPDLPGTDVHLGIVVGVIAVVAAGSLYHYTTVGLKLWVIGQNRRAAVHAGMPVGRLTVAALLVSGGFAGLAGANDVLATFGLFKQGFPAYGLAGFALVYLARLRALWVLPCAFLFGWLELGGDLVRSEDVPNYFIGMLEGLMLLFLAVAVVVERRVASGGRAARAAADRERQEALALTSGTGGVP